MTEKFHKTYSFREKLRRSWYWGTLSNICDILKSVVGIYLAVGIVIFAIMSWVKILSWLFI